MTLPEKVLIVTPLYPPDSVGGTQLHARKLAHWLTTQGVTVQVVCVGNIERGAKDALVSEKREVVEGILVHRLYLTHTNTMTAFRHAYEHPDIADYLERLIQSWKPDLVHLISGYLVTPAVIVVAHALGVPSVVTLTDYWFICPRINLIRSNQEPCGGPYDALDCTRCLLSESRRYRFPEQAFPALANLAWRLLARGGANHIALHREVARRSQYLCNLLNQADAITIPTNSLRSRLVGAGIQDRFVLSRHGLVLDELGIQPGVAKSPSGTLRFGFLGTVIHNKGVDLLVEAYARIAAQHNNISLEIWGDTSTQPEYVRLLQEKLDSLPRAAIRGRYQVQQLGEIMRNIDVLVVPSRWPEIGPFVVLEAFATQTPVIATRLGNMIEIIDHNRNGLLFELNSVEDLYFQMRRLIEEPDLHMRLKAGIPEVRTHADEMTEVLGVYHDLLQSHVGHRLHEGEA